MKKTSRIISAVMVSAMAVSMLAGCGSSSTGSASSTAASTAAASADTESAAASGATFKIGAIGPLTGGAAAYGNAVCNAAELAAKEINANGGMNGYQVEV
ncbi:MAG: ABC transporter substrate-binding protein, partial [Lachnospiraceae bacterium]|nr:ABC transporter substrate-binding protein [Lachnospiraceae bacterium]